MTLYSIILNTFVKLLRQDQQGMAGYPQFEGFFAYLSRLMYYLQLYSGSCALW